MFVGMPSLIITHLHTNLSMQTYQEFRKVKFWSTVTDYHNNLFLKIRLFIDTIISDI